MFLSSSAWHTGPDCTFPPSLNPRDLLGIHVISRSQLPSARCWVVSITALHTSSCCRTPEQLDHIKKKKVYRRPCITASADNFRLLTVTLWLCTRRSGHKDQLAGAIWCYHQNKADGYEVSRSLLVQKWILHYLGQSATMLKSMRAQRAELQAKWTQKGLKWGKELRSIRTAEKGITFVLEILISWCQSTAEAQQPA